MTPSPVLPPEFKAEISSPEATLCGNFISTLLKLPTSLYKLVNWLLDSNGNVTNEFKQQILPAGVISPYAGASVPTDWLLCNGQEVARADYPELFAAIGILYGTPSGSTTFKLPDLRNRFPIGAGTNALAEAGGDEERTLDDDMLGGLLTHQHVTGRFRTTSEDDVNLLIGTLTDAPTSGNTQKINGELNANQTQDMSALLGAYTIASAPLPTPEPEAFSLLPPFLSLNFIIKT